MRSCFEVKRAGEFPEVEIFPSAVIAKLAMMRSAIGSRLRGEERDGQKRRSEEFTQRAKKDLRILKVRLLSPHEQRKTTDHRLLKNFLRLE